MGILAAMGTVVTFYLAISFLVSGVWVAAIVIDSLIKDIKAWAQNTRNSLRNLKLKAVQLLRKTKQ